MKATKLTFLLISVALVSHAQDKQDKTDLEKEKLNGKVRTMAVTGYTVERIDGKLQKGRTIHTTNKQLQRQGVTFWNLLHQQMASIPCRMNMCNLKPVRNSL